MKNYEAYLPLLSHCALFHGIDMCELPDALRFLEAHDRTYQKGEMIFLIGDPVRHAQNVFLNRKARILGQKKLRDKIKVFLRGQSIAEDGSVRSGFNRNELARFLGVNRSALSRELSRMQKEGILSLEGKNLRLCDRGFLSGESI